MQNLVVIDAGIADYQQLLTRHRSGTEVLVLDAATDGVLQIAGYLQGKGGYNAIHVFSHGSTASVRLGGSVLSMESLASYVPELKSIGNALTSDGDLLLYGCNVAAGQMGVQFIADLAQFTGADVAASDDFTGSFQLGGDVDLEKSIGAVDTTSILDQPTADQLGQLLGTHVPIALSATYLDNTQITQGFGGDYSHNRNPWSLDFNLASGDAVHPLLSGTVYSIRTGATKEDTGEAAAFGNFVTVKDENGLFATYAHLSSIDESIVRGDAINPSNVLGKVGNTGFVTGPHLHVHFGYGKAGTDLIGSGDVVRASGGGDSFSPIYFAAHFDSKEVGIYGNSIDDLNERTSNDIFGTGRWGGTDDGYEWETLPNETEPSWVFFGDELNGTAASNRILGGGGPDHLNGNGGDDLLVGGTGNDVIVGGANGLAGDIALFVGHVEDYRIKRDGDSVFVLRNSTNEMDTLQGVEILSFYDDGWFIESSKLPDHQEVRIENDGNVVVVQSAREETSIASVGGNNRFVFDLEMLGIGPVAESIMKSAYGYTLNLLQFLTPSIAEASPLYAGNEGGLKFSGVTSGLSARSNVNLYGYSEIQVENWDVVPIAKVREMAAGALYLDDFGMTSQTAGMLASTPVGVYASASGGIQTAGDIDRFSVQLLAGHKYAFSGMANSGALDPFLRLYSTSDQKIAENDNTATGTLSAFIVYTPTVSGEYHVDITGNRSSTGQYFLVASDTSLTPDASNLVPIEKSIDPGPVSWWSWEGTSSADDYEWTGTGPAHLRGHAGDDRITGGNGKGNQDEIYGDDGNDSLWGEGGPDLIRGGKGDDNIYGGAGNDVLHGESGDDNMFGNDGDDYIHGFTGRDNISAGNGNDYVKGGDESDVISGGSGDDELYGDEGDDEVNGGNGDDIIKGGSGNDFELDGDAGNDRIEGESGRDRLFGDAGNDLLFGGADADELFGGAGNNLLDGGDGIDWADYSQAGAYLSYTINLFDGRAVSRFIPTGDAQLDLAIEADGGVDQLVSIENVRGGSWDDRIDGNHAENAIDGGAGNDVVRGHNGNDMVSGDQGDDVVWGDEGLDIVRGGSGNDELRGGLGNDLLEGGAGDDELRGEQGDDVLDGGDGFDVAFFWGEREDFEVLFDGSGTYSVSDERQWSNAEQDEGADLVSNIELFRFFDGDIPVAQILSAAPQAFNDSATLDEDFPLVVNVLLNDIDPEANALTLVDMDDSGFLGKAYVAAGRIVIDPTSAFDYLGEGETAQAEISYTVTDGYGWRSKASIMVNVIGKLEELLGTQDDDHLVGTSAADRIDAQEGNDIVEGAAGADELTGGAGADHFSDTAANFNNDRITDFGLEDFIDIPDVRFTALRYTSATGVLELDTAGNGSYATKVNLATGIVGEFKATPSATGLAASTQVRLMQDTDGDGVGDFHDNAIFVANTDQRDTDGDGYGNIIDADFNQDGFVDFFDLSKFEDVFFTGDPNSDMNGDGLVDFFDLSLLEELFFQAPGVSYVDGAVATLSSGMELVAIGVSANSADIVFA